ncbi:hypothetical protein [Kitasatospora phosalacinea]|uniref:Gram-positive cocci surface proteins LPxTG domain-containing protein n=1 Tax=Kitasatospora phosalacinea TaxID=2065 RepID=A0ABW6GHP9_9ACTN
MRRSAATIWAVLVLLATGWCATAGAAPLPPGPPPAAPYVRAGAVPVPAPPPGAGADVGADVGAVAVPVPPPLPDAGAEDPGAEELGTVLVGAAALLVLGAVALVFARRE